MVGGSTEEGAGQCHQESRRGNRVIPQHVAVRLVASDHPRKIKRIDEGDDTVPNAEFAQS